MMGGGGRGGGLGGQFVPLYNTFWVTRKTRGKSSECSTAAFLTEDHTLLRDHLLERSSPPLSQHHETPLLFFYFIKPFFLKLCCKSGSPFKFKPECKQKFIISFSAEGFSAPQAEIHLYKPLFREGHTGDSGLGFLCTHSQSVSLSMGRMGF